MSKPIALLVCGSRSWTNRLRVSAVLAEYPASTLLLHGGAPGADTLAREYWKAVDGRQVELPYFGHLDKRGGPCRNVVLAKWLRALEETGGYDPRVEAFQTGQTPGTTHMVETARRYLFQTRVWTP